MVRKCDKFEIRHFKLNLNYTSHFHFGIKHLVKSADHGQSSIDWKAPKSAVTLSDVLFSIKAA